MKQEIGIKRNMKRNSFEHMAYFLLLETRKEFKGEKVKLLNEIKINQPGIWNQLYTSEGKIDLEKLKKYLLKKYSSIGINNNIIELFFQEFDEYAYNQDDTSDKVGGDPEMDLQFIRGDFEDFLNRKFNKIYTKLQNYNLDEIKINDPTIPKWKIASDKINNLRKQGKEDTKEYYQAYVDYYDAMIEKEGDSNGYYYSCKKDYQDKANKLDEIKINNPSFQFPKNENWTYIVKNEKELIKILNLLKSQGWLLRHKPEFTDKAYPVFVFGYSNKIVEISFMWSKHGKVLNPQDAPEGYLDEIKVNNPSPLETLKRNLVKVIELDKEYAGGDEDMLEIIDEVIDDIKSANSEQKIKNILYHYTLGEKDQIRHYLDLATKKSQLNEYSEKTITTTIDRWKKENPKVDDNIAKQIIQRFDQIKNGLSQKLQIVSLSDELKKNNNYLNIDKYSFDDMVKLIRSLPENPDKIKKDAINKFVDKETVDRTMAQSYVARFMAKRDALKHGVESGLEDLDMKAEDIKKLIPKFLLQNGAFLDPRNWKWEPFEQMLDALFPSQKEHGEIENNVTTDADKVYDKGGIEIYKGDDVHKCISYNPANIKKDDIKYGWCVTQPGNTNYDHYRFEERSPTFYFVFDRNKTSSPGKKPFKDKWHAIVIQVNADAKSYVVTSADNDADARASSWEDISKIVPPETWSRIKDLKDYFKPIPLSSVERGRKFASGKNLSLAEFKELTQDEKILYIQGKASKNQIGKDILAILPKYKIDYEGRSTTLANVAIDNGQKFSYEDLKDTESLAKRYAVFRFRHTDYSKDPLPLPFIKFLDEPGKEKYLKIFDENLNFDLIEKFFGEKAAETYVNNEVKNLQYVPPKAVKYIKDAKTKQLYSIYHKLTESWNFSDNFKLDEKSISKLTDMPVQDVTPVPINQEQWGKLSNEERKVIVDLAGKVNGNSKYSTLLYALPYIVKDGDKTYALLPKDNKDFTYDKWSLVDLNGKVVKDNISGDATLGDNTLITGYPSDNEKINRIYDIKSLKGVDKKLKEIKVNNPQITPEIIEKFIDDNKIRDYYDGALEFSNILKDMGWIHKKKHSSTFIKSLPFDKLTILYKKLKGLVEKHKDYLKENQSFNIPNPDYYQKLLNMSNSVSPSTAKYFQDVINSVKKQNGKATEKQWRILQRIKTGEFNLSTKN